MIRLVVIIPSRSSILYQDPDSNKKASVIYCILLYCCWCSHCFGAHFAHCLSDMGQKHHLKTKSGLGFRQKRVKTSVGKIVTPKIPLEKYNSPSFHLDLPYTTRVKYHRRGKQPWFPLRNIIFIHGGFSTSVDIQKMVLVHLFRGYDQWPQLSLMSLAVSMRCSAGTSLRYFWGVVGNHCWLNQQRTIRGSTNMNT